MRILLVHAAENLLALTNDLTQIVAGNVSVFVQPYLADDGAELLGDRSLRTIAAMELFCVAFVRDEEVLQLWRIAQTLHDAVHVAGVAEVLESRQSVTLLDDFDNYLNGFKMYRFKTTSYLLQHNYQLQFHFKSSHHYCDAYCI